MMPMRFIVLTVLVACALPVAAQWTQTNGPHAGWEQPIAAGGNYFFAATNRGLCRSSDKGDTWNLILTMPTSSVVVHDSTVFAGGYSNNLILRSTDLGDHWLVVTGAGFDQFVTLIYSQNILLAGGQYGIRRSTDEGITWVPSDSSAPKWISSFFTKGNAIYALSWMMGDYQSTDTGRSWQKMNSPGANDGLFFLTTNGTDLFVPKHNFLYRSTNDGAQWNVVDSGFYGSIHTVLAVSNIICAAGNWGWYRSVDGGVTCTRTPSGLNSSFVSWLVSVNGIFFAETPGGVFRSKDSGATWQYVHINPGFARASALMGNGSAVYAGTGNGVFASFDEGVSWNAVNYGITLSAPVTFMGFQSGTVFAYADASGNPSSQGELFRSSDRGIHWTDAGVGGWEAYMLTCLASDSVMIVAGSNSGVQLSLDTGTSWIGSGFGPNEWVSTLALQGTKIFVGLRSSGVAVSFDSCKTWTHIDTGLAEKNIHAIIVVGDTIIAGASSGNIYRSLDNGAHWKRVFSDSNTIASNAMIFMGSTVFASTNNGLLRSTDVGATWSDISDGLKGDAIGALCANTQFLFAASQSSGVWRRPLSELIVTEVQNQSSAGPSDFTLDQNYPDPFASATTIAYVLPRREHISLKVFNVMGEIQQTVVNEEQQSGRQQVEISAAQLRPGVYFYQLATEGFVGVKKMVVVR